MSHLADTTDRRTAVAQEILASEEDYVDTLEIIQDVFHTPLRNALKSNRWAVVTYRHGDDNRIISSSDLDIIILWGKKTCLLSVVKEDISNHYSHALFGKAELSPPILEACSLLLWTSLWKSLIVCCCRGVGFSFQWTGTNSWQQQGVVCLHSWHSKVNSSQYSLISRFESFDTVT